MKSRETRSTAQGVGGNPESEGCQGKHTGPSESKPEPARQQGRPSPEWGKPCVTNGWRVCEAGMHVSSLHDDLGRPSALRSTDTKVEVQMGKGRYPTGAVNAVVSGAILERRGQGVGCDHSNDEDSGNRERVKGHWSAEGVAEKTRKTRSKERTGMAEEPEPPSTKDRQEREDNNPKRVEQRRGHESTEKWPRWEGRKLHSVMSFLYRKKTLAIAWDEVRRNKGAPGVDGESVGKFGEHASERLKELSEKLRTRRWQPKPLRRVWIPKPDGTKRGLAIPCVEDRIVHGAVAKVLYPIFEDTFGPDCYAYVRGRNALDAVSRVIQEANAGKEWAVETDVKKFFDSMDRKRLMDKLAKRIADGTFLRLISAIVRSGVLGEITENETGIPQGSPLSPLLANIYLADFDRKIGARWTLIRYADDLVVLCKTEKEAKDAQNAVVNALNEEGLSIKPEKTRITQMKEGIDLLGYRITTGYAEPSRKARKGLQEKIRSVTVRHDTRPLEEVIPRMMPIITGWTNYFCLSRLTTMWDVGKWILRRTKSYKLKRAWMGKKFSETSTETLYSMGLKLPYHIIKDKSRIGRESRMR